MDDHKAAGSSKGCCLAMGFKLLLRNLVNHENVIAMRAARTEELDRAAGQLPGHLALR